MGDKLTYKLPFESVIQKTGRFKKVAFGDLDNGFIVSNFDKSEAFLFVEGETSSEIKRTPNDPVCYDKSTYLEKARTFIDQIQFRGLSKAILSRVMRVGFTGEAEDLFDKLCLAYPSAFVYLVSSESFGTWIGATPESLISCNREFGETVALAGTMNSDEDSVWGDKERFEQQFVSDFISKKLTELNVTSILQEGPTDRIAGPVKHLETRFHFSMEDQRAIRIAENLHPTPAVSGLPQKEAIELINELEEHDRGLYTGCIGILGEKTDLFVNLRCAQIIENEIFLYLGGGFTKDSVPDLEWRETENKSRTLLDIIENF